MRRDVLAITKKLIRRNTVTISARINNPWIAHRDMSEVFVFIHTLSLSLYTLVFSQTFLDTYSFITMSWLFGSSPGTSQSQSMHLRHLRHPRFPIADACAMRNDQHS